MITLFTLSAYFDHLYASFLSCCFSCMLFVIFSFLFLWQIISALLHKLLHMFLTLVPFWPFDKLCIVCNI